MAIHQIQLLFYIYISDISVLTEVMGQLTFTAAEGHINETGAQTSGIPEGNI